MATSQNGWSVITSASLDKTPFPGTSIVPAPGVRAGDVATILLDVGRVFNETVEKLVNPGCWGWVNKKISGSSDISNHASGTAIDLNAPKHPQYKHNTFTAAQVSAIRALLARYDGVVRWGGDYPTGDWDEMHFEINANAAAVAKVSARLREGGAQDAITPAPTPVSASVSGNISFTARRGTFTVTVNALHVRSAPSTTSAIVATYAKGQRFAYDGFKITSGYVWLTYIGNSGVRRWVAEGPYDGNPKNVWGKGGI